MNALYRKELPPAIVKQANLRFGEPRNAPYRTFVTGWHGPAHGHTIVHAIEHGSEDVLQIERSLYPALHRVEDRGWIASFWGTSDNKQSEVLPPDIGGAKAVDCADNTLGAGGSGTHSEAGRGVTEMSFRRFFSRPKWDRERLEEVESYVQIETGKNIARGGVLLFTLSSRDHTPDREKCKPPDCDGSAWVSSIALEQTRQLAVHRSCNVNRPFQPVVISLLIIHSV
jgi:hypothetical protein